MSTPIYHFTLLRHGESVGNAEGRYQGQADYPLSELGLQQARKLAERWIREDIHFDRVIASPLSRAHQTAKIICSALDTPITLEPLWMERNNGLIAGLKADEAPERFPQAEFVHPYQPVGQTGESELELFVRAGQAIQKLFIQPAGRYLIVSHGGIMNKALYIIMGLAPQANFAGPRFNFGNTGFATLSYEPARHIWRVLGIDDRAHLDGLS